MKKSVRSAVCGVLGAWCLVLGAWCLVPCAARAAEEVEVSYWDPEGKELESHKCLPLTTSATTITLKSGGWYYVEGTVNAWDGIDLENDAHIILKDGSYLNVQRNSYAPGIAVQFDTNSDNLYIHGQEKGTGRLVSRGYAYCAGIGGTYEDGKHSSCGCIRIYGGIVEAYGGMYAPGIGGSRYPTCSGNGPEELYIYGGRVIAKGGAEGMGVGSANGCDGKHGYFDVEIYGGVLEATGNYHGLGIGFCDVSGNISSRPCKIYSDYGAIWTDPSSTAADPYEFVGENTSGYSKSSSFIRVAGLEKLDSGTDDLANGWYVAVGNATHDSLSVVGSMILMLRSGCNLTITAKEEKEAGLQVPSGTSLEIYGQDDGKLTANGGSFGAGIGGGNEGAGGNVTIKGGTVTANGGSYGAGIGGGYSGNGGEVTINGGTVTANGGSYGAGIGGGYYGGAGGKVTINGGIVTAQGGAQGAGIGGGSGGQGGTVTINGGIVTTQAAIDAFGNSGAGIGGGFLGGGGGRVTITDGAVTAKGSDAFDAAEISGGIFGMELKPDWIDDGYCVVANADSKTSASYPYAVVPLVTVTVRTFEGALAAVTVNGVPVAGFTGGELRVDPGTEVAVDYAASDGWAIFGTTHFDAKATDGRQLPAAGDGPTLVRVFTVTVPAIDGASAAVKTNDVPVAGFTSGQLAVLPDTVVTVDYTPQDGQPFQGLMHFDVTVKGNQQVPAAGMEPALTEPVSYMAPEPDGAGGIVFVERTANATPVTAGTGRFSAGYWYVVKDNVSRGSIDVLPGAAVNLILADGAKLTADSSSVSDLAGINVGTNETLNIYAQRLGTGQLKAMGGWSGAGIGGGYLSFGGTVTIHGGTVTANGGDNGAGIGGGYQSAGGNVTINGGTVTANGGMSAAGIGGGSKRGAGGTVTINGGTVTATGGTDYNYKGAIVGAGAGIGGGDEGTGGKVTINGGTVTAIGKVGSKGIGGSMGIGGGMDNGGGSVTINGGTVRAEGGDALGETVTLDFGVYASDITASEPGTLIRDKAALTTVDKIHVADQLPFPFESIDDDHYYIESSGGAYIDTKYVPTVNTRIVADFNSMTRSEIWSVFFGVTSKDNADDGVLLRNTKYDNMSLNAWFCGSSEMITGFDGKRLTAELKTGSITLDGTDYTFVTSGTPYDGSIYIFCGNIGGSAWRPQEMRLYSFQIYEGEALKRDFVPFRTTDGSNIAGLYDRVSKRCVINAGDGSLTLGADLVSVTVDGDMAHLTAAWTGGDGSETNAVTDGFCEVTMGMTDVKVIFTPEDGYMFAEAGETGVRALASPLVEDCTVAAPAVVGVPCAVTFTVGEGIARAAYVCGDVTNALAAGETTVEIPFATEVKLVVDELPYYYPFGGARAFTVNDRTMTVEISAVPIPEGIEAHPWQVGEDVQAYTNGEGVLTITGTGAMDDFADAADVPWDPAAVESVEIGDGVTQIGANAWAGMVDTVTINGTALSFIGFAASGLTPAGTSLPEGTIPVTKTELEAAGAATLTIVDGTAYVGVSVRTNGDLTAKTKSWGKVKFDKDVRVDVSEDGTELVIPVPANAQQGFMVLESGEAETK